MSDAPSKQLGGGEGLDSDGWRRVKELFAEVVDLDPEARRAHLDSVCGDDRELRAEVESLVAADDTGPGVLGGSIFDAAGLGGLVSAALDAEAPRVGEPIVGRRFGPYRVVQELGRGGMAVVYAAVRDDDQYRKQVAIKLIKRGMDTEAIVGRFLNERQILANLEHPSIARLLDGGMSDDGLPYLVMEQVDGLPIDEFCRQQGLDLEPRLHLFQAVCRTVHFAHQNLVVHRDLKPSNILVTPAGEPKLLDFGIAKLLQAEGDSTPGAPQSLVGLRPMTPEYASPEQVQGRPLTTSSDVFALGVLLYQLLTGTRPFRIGSQSPREIERVVCEEEPPPPSQVETDDPALGSDSRRRLSGDLDTIVAKALRKRPERRYSSAEALAADLDRYLEGRPVIARRDTLGYRAGKFVRRNRWGVLTAAGVFLALLVAVVVTSNQARVANDQRAKAEAVADFLVDIFETNHPDKALGETITARQLLEEGARRVEEVDDERPEVRSMLLDTIGLAYFKLGLYERAEPLLVGALEARRRGSGGDGVSRELATSLGHVGDLLKAQGRYAEAESFHRRSLEVESRLGDGPGHRAGALQRLAVAIYLQGRWLEAEETLRRAIVLWDAAADDGAEDAEDERSTALNDLALVLKSQGRLDEAESLYRQVLDDNRRRLGEGHPEIAANLNNLGELLRERGRCDEAIGLFERSLELKSTLYGESHPLRALGQHNLAGCYADHGRHQEAEQLYGSALALRREVLGSEHRLVASTLNNLARIFLDRREGERAEGLLREALTIHRQSLGDDHPDVATNLDNLARALELQRDLVGAESLRRQALEIQRRLHGDEHLQVAAVRHNLAELLRRQGRLAEAETEFRQALEVRRGELDAEHPSVANTLFGLGVTLAVAAGTSVDGCQEAEPVLHQGLDRWRGAEDGKTQVAVLESLLGGCLVTRREFERAEPILLSSYQALPDPRTRARLATLYEAWGKPDLAEGYRAPDGDR